MNRGGAIFAAVMIAVIVLTVGGMVLASATGNSQSLAVSYEEAFDGVTGIAVDAGSAAVRVGPSPDGRAHVGVTSQRRYECSVEDGKLVFRWTDVSFGVFLNNWGEKVEILLPEGMEDVAVYASSGRIEMWDFACASLTARASSGSVQADRIACAGEASLTASSGRVQTQGVAAQSLKLQTSSGSVSAQDISAVDVWAKASSGSVKLSLDGRGETLEASTSSGSIQIALAAPMNGSVRASSGSVRLEAAQGQSVYCSTRSGSVRVNGQRVATDGRQGGYALSGGEAELRVETSSGSIRIEH